MIVVQNLLFLLFLFQNINKPSAHHQYLKRKHDITFAIQTNRRQVDNNDFFCIH
jgi:hypothetical protein